MLTNFPSGWDEERVQRVLRHYDSLSEEEMAAEDEAAFEDSTQVVMEVPKELAPAVRILPSPVGMAGERPARKHAFRLPPTPILTPP